MAKAHQLPSGRWRIQPYANGQRTSIVANSEAEANYLAEQWQKGIIESLKPENRTVATMMERYIKERTNILSPTTISGYRRIQRLYFQNIKDKKVGQLTASDVQIEVNTMAAKLSPKTIRNAVGFLSAACDLRFKLTLPKKEKIFYKTPGVRGIKTILNQTKGTSIEVPVLLALWCGLRLSEIRGLRFDHVFSDHIVIDQAIVDVDGVPTIKGTKTKESTRIIDINPWLYNRIVQEKSNDSDYVTTLSGQAIYKRFRRQTGGVCRFHDLRHANASVMIMLGIPDNFAMERNGWETESIYKKTYGQVLPESREESNKALNDFFQGLVN